VFGYDNESVDFVCYTMINELTFGFECFKVEYTGGFLSGTLIKRKLASVDN